MAIPALIKEKYVIASEFINEVSGRVSEDKRVRRKLPLNGRLHIDRSLPFICVYRRPVTDPDKGTERFVPPQVITSRILLMSSWVVSFVFS
jgi:hypothetical protein